VKTAAFVGAAVLLLLLDAVASVRVAGSGVLSRAQKTAWLLVIWLAPMIGAIFAMNVSREASVPAPAPGAIGDSPNPGIEPTKTGYL
jgi:hypothetical protein